MFITKYINVDCATDRNKAMHDMLLINLDKGQSTFSRFSAVNKNEIILPTTSKYSAGEIACFQSHLFCIEAELNHNSSILILEDDVVIAQEFTKIYHLIDNSNFDLIFLAVTFGKNLTNYEYLLNQGSPTKLINLKNIGFAGTYGYYIPNKSKRKVWNILIQGLQRGDIPLPLDLYYAHNAHHENLNCAVITPYYLKLNEYSSNSIIGGSNNTQKILDLLTNSLYINIDPVSFLNECENQLNISKKDILLKGLVQCIAPSLAEIKFRQ